MISQWLSGWYRVQTYNDNWVGTRSPQCMSLVTMLDGWCGNFGSSQMIPWCVKVQISPCSGGCRPIIIIIVILLMFIIYSLNKTTQNVILRICHPPTRDIKKSIKTQPIENLNNSLMTVAHTWEKQSQY